MVVLRDQDRRRLARDGVEQLLRRLDPGCPVAVAPAVAAQPASGRDLGLAHAGERLLDRRAAVQLHLALRERPGREVDVRVGEGGEDAAAAEVHDLRARERGLVDADAARDVRAGDRERPSRRAATGSSVRTMPFSRITAVSLARTEPFHSPNTLLTPTRFASAGRRRRVGACAGSSGSQVFSRPRRSPGSSPAQRRSRRRRPRSPARSAAVGPTSATVSGTVNPGGQATTWYVEYGTSTSYGSQSASASVGSGSANVAVSRSLSGLAAGTTYHYRVVATNGAGTSRGADGIFTTLSAPAVVTGAAIGRDADDGDAERDGRPERPRDDVVLRVRDEHELRHEDGREGRRLRRQRRRRLGGTREPRPRPRSTTTGSSRRATPARAAAPTRPSRRSERPPSRPTPPRRWRRRRRG